VAGPHQPITYEELQAQTRLELTRRLEVLSGDVALWTVAARLNSMGLSPSQRLVLVDFMKILQQRRDAAFDRIKNPLPSSEFAEGKANLLLEMTGAQEVWHVFRTILGQHEDIQAKTAVKAAARVAGDCYAFCIRRAREWNAISPDRFREQPLVLLEAVESPATAGRQDRVRALSTAVRQWRDVKLPLPIVLLPADYGQSIWTFCALHHEVGHNIDQDLNLAIELRAPLLDIVPAAQEPHWRRWTAEILADVFGVLLGGAGFAASLGSMALLLAPAKDFSELDEQAVHPPFVLRVRLIVEILRQTGVAGLETWAGELQAIWEAAQKPDWVAPFAAQAPQIAGHFLKRQLAALANHQLLELNPKLAEDQQRIEQLAHYFLSGKNRPVPSKDAGMHPRLVPCAAQLAVRGTQQLSLEMLEKLQSGALAYLDLIPPIEHLAAPVAHAAQRREYLQQLARELDYRRLPVTDQEVP
jgi:hypothetical protein